MASGKRRHVLTLGCDTPAQTQHKAEVALGVGGGGEGGGRGGTWPSGKSTSLSAVVLCLSPVCERKMKRREKQIRRFRSE